MLEFLRDQIWQFIGAALGLIAIIVSVILYLRGRSRKALMYELDCNSLVTEPEEAQGHIEIRFGTQQVRNVHLLLVKIVNSGNQPIRSNDFEGHLILSVDEPARILTAEVVATDPDSLPKELLCSEDGESKCRYLPPERALATELRELPLARTLLNGGDSFTIKMLLSEYAPGGFHLKGRVVGVKEIRMRKKADRSLWTRIWIFRRLQIEHRS